MLARALHVESVSQDIQWERVSGMGLIICSEIEHEMSVVCRIEKNNCG